MILEGLEKRISSLGRPGDSVIVQDSPEGVIGLNSLVVIPPPPVMLKSVALVTILAALYGLLIYITLSTPPKERYNRYVPRLHGLFHMFQNMYPSLTPRRSNVIMLRLASISMIENSPE
jgi:hypothetical protein